jgi:hypothetical protein
MRRVRPQVQNEPEADFDPIGYAALTDIRRNPRLGIIQGAPE